MSVPARIAGVPSLAQIATDRALLDSLPADALIQLRREVAYLREDVDAAVTRCLARSLLAEPRAAEADRWLAPAEAAKIFNVTRRWLLEHADEIAGSRRLSKKVVRFSARKLERFLNGMRA
jgi:hypothetical protein